MATVAPATVAREYYSFLYTGLSVVKWRTMPLLLSSSRLGAHTSETSRMNGRLVMVGVWLVVGNWPELMLADPYDR
jgi:hypothetical protein